MPWLIALLLILSAGLTAGAWVYARTHDVARGEIDPSAVMMFAAFLTFLIAVALTFMASAPANAAEGRLPPVPTTPEITTPFVTYGRPVAIPRITICNDRTMGVTICSGGQWYGDRDLTIDNDNHRIYLDDDDARD